MPIQKQIPSGVARPLAARYGCQICRPSVFGNRLYSAYWTVYSTLPFTFSCVAQCVRF